MNTLSRLWVGGLLSVAALLAGCSAARSRSEIGAAHRGAFTGMPTPEAGFRVVNRYLTDGYQLDTPETLLLEPIVEPGRPNYQLLVGPARDGTPLRADVHNSAVTLSLQNGFAVASGTQPIVVVKRVVAAAEGTTILVEGDRNHIVVLVLQAEPSKPVRVYFEGEDASRGVAVGNWQYVRLRTTGTRIPPAQNIPFPGSGLADPDGIGPLLQFSFAKRIQTGQIIAPNDADGVFVAGLRR